MAVLRQRRSVSQPPRSRSSIPTWLVPPRTRDDADIKPRQEASGSIRSASRHELPRGSSQIRPRPSRRIRPLPPLPMVTWSVPSVAEVVPELAWPSNADLHKPLAHMASELCRSAPQQQQTPPEALGEPALAEELVALRRASRLLLNKISFANNVNITMQIIGLSFPTEHHFGVLVDVILQEVMATSNPAHVELLAQLIKQLCCTVPDVPPSATTAAAAATPTEQAPVAGSPVEPASTPYSFCSSAQKKRWARRRPCRVTSSIVSSASDFGMASGSCGSDIGNADAGRALGGTVGVVAGTEATCIARPSQPPLPPPPSWNEPVSFWATLVRCLQSTYWKNRSAVGSYVPQRNATQGDFDDEVHLKNQVRILSLLRLVFCLHHLEVLPFQISKLCVLACLTPVVDEGDVAAAAPPQMWYQSKDLSSVPASCLPPATLVSTLCLALQGACRIFCKTFQGIEFLSVAMLALRSLQVNFVGLYRGAVRYHMQGTIDAMQKCDFTVNLEPRTVAQHAHRDGL
eukprot:NODE_3569_length_2017_cov_7.909524.p1 GENE.NODE_3569_length_2017_cov_7.909524~~NODE_3569_length_2017_cov_7.909524.p1  ORF type:complete len:602 (+),score=125.11 NODE_3569_length_2017_cov_7.909524:257-1807(+)